ncbi:hypothetical protein PR048_031255 [Dryococelus australis]|uniref:Transposase n=1 Tax=Dryococelus australis TaxID=614101 RepID=A0ABQ9G5G7_9NEOP|nr:hypothetical protein PR048_031255 [Dryococelus australis]
MSRNRLDKFRNDFHASDNDKMKPRDDPEYDKLFKVRPFLDKVRNNFSCVEAEEHNLVDEAYFPKTICEKQAPQMGYQSLYQSRMQWIVYDFEICNGKGRVINISSLGISGGTGGLPKNKHFKVFTDNWFTLYGLICALKEVGIMADFKVGRVSHDYRTESEQNIIALKWFDNRSVHLVSSFKGEKKTQWNLSNIDPWQSDSTLTLPDLLLCNIGVKIFDLRIVFHLTDMCVVNAWLLYRRHCTQRGFTKHLPILALRSDMAHALLKPGHSVVRKRGRPSQDSPTPSAVKKRAPLIPNPVDEVRFDNTGHWPEHLANKQRYKLCIKAYSRVKCSKCDKALCFTKDKNCYLKYHGWSPRYYNGSKRSRTIYLSKSRHSAVKRSASLAKIKCCGGGGRVERLDFAISVDKNLGRSLRAKQLNLFGVATMPREVEQSWAARFSLPSEDFTLTTGGFLFTRRRERPRERERVAHWALPPLLSRRRLMTVLSSCRPIILVHRLGCASIIGRH